MPKRIELAIFSLTLIFLVLASADRDNSNKPTLPNSSFERGPTVDLISSSHQDIAWMNSPQACMEYRDAQVITPALEMMRKNPAYCFTMENMLNLTEYLERHPDRRDEIYRFTKEGRLEWGATLNQPYESLLSGEQLIRETYFGRKWLKKMFPGCDAKVYFNPDVPGRALQMQQILSKAGIPYLIISRYHEGYYRWLSPDGSSVVAYSPGHYSNASTILGAAPAEGAELIEQKLARWATYYSQRKMPPEFPLLNSVDFSKPTDFGPLINFWNAGHVAKDGSGESRMRYSSARQFFDGLTKTNPNLDQVMGERPNLWLYIHGPTHHWAISAQREAGILLPAAETFNTISSLLDGNFQRYPTEEMREAWMAAIYPDHGWGGKEGQVTDRLFRKKYEFARDRGKEMLGDALGRIASQVKISPSQGLPVIVFNPLSWERTDLVVIAVKYPPRNWRVQDARGNILPSQALPPLLGQTEGTTRLEFIARAVPPLGYKTFYLVEDTSLSARSPEAVQPEDVYENKFYKVEFAPGGLKRIFDKELGRDLLNTQKFLGFEVFTMQSVGNGAGEFGRVQQPTMDGFDKLSAHKTPWKFEARESGPLKAVFKLKQLLSNCTIEETMIIYNDLKRIICEVAILDWDGTPYREFRLALPVNAPGGQVAYEVPMGVVEVGKSEIPGTGGPAYGNLNYDEPCSEIRPREVQNFLSASGADFGLTMSTSVAVNDYFDPTSNPVSYPVLQAVLLASRRSCHGEGNWYLQEGDHYYRFSIFSHTPGWKNGCRLGMQANAPLLAVVNPQSEGHSALPEEKSFFSVTAPNILISTIKKAEDDDSVVVRFYDIEGKDTEVQLNCFFQAAKSELVNIIEAEGTPLPFQKNALELKVGHHAIETVKLWPQKAEEDLGGFSESPKDRAPSFIFIKPGEPLDTVVRTAAQIVPLPRQMAWQEMEFIAFAHFGMNTFTEREWGEGTESPTLFNPTDFDARQWVKALKEAGVKMLILTAKHHDGFCLWPSRYTEHSIKASPWRGGKGDIVKEAAEACRDAGLKFGIYLSPWDRHEPTYGDSPAYNEHFRRQLRELLTNYGEISEVWFDGACGEGPNGKRQVYDWPSYYRVVRELQPQAVIFGMGPDLRWVGTESGYGRETEWSVVPVEIKIPERAADASPQKPPSLDDLFIPGDMTAEDLGSREKIKDAKALAWYPAETDVSIRPGWFYHQSQDGEVKTPEKLVDIYFSSVGRNSVLLLNVPPDKRGLIHDSDIKSLQGMRRILDRTFAQNLARGAGVKASNEVKGHKAGFVLDEDKMTYWTTDKGVETATIEFAFPEPRAFDVAMLQEFIRDGQRVEEFSLEAWDGKEWRPFAKGTTVGYKRLLRFPEVAARKIRLLIINSRLCPALSSFGLFKSSS